MIEPSVWQALGQRLLDREIPPLDAIDDKADEQGTKRKVVELDMETETANRKRRIWKARRKPVAVEQNGTKDGQRNRNCSFVNVL